MTEQVIADAQGTVNDQAERPTEKMVPQSTVDRAVQAAKNSAYEKGMRDGATSQQPQQPVQQQSMGGMAQMSPDEIDRKIAEGVQKNLMGHVQQMQHSQMVNDYASKVSAGKDRYSDFEQVVAPLHEDGGRAIQSLLPFLSSTDNPADVVYELGKNQSKLANLVVLTHMYPNQPQLVQAEVKKLSDSIKQNQAAAQQAKANEPLSQVTASTAGADSGSMLAKDYRKQSWAKV